MKCCLCVYTIDKHTTWVISCMFIYVYKCACMHMYMDVYVHSYMCTFVIGAVTINKFCWVILIPNIFPRNSFFLWTITTRYTGNIDSFLHLFYLYNIYSAFALYYILKFTSNFTDLKRSAYFYLSFYRIKSWNPLYI